jgi:hypothetical protein|tara:strand:- start:413 stop:1063 length:651 start_codon:yes stop_codon:yes gene_type:complete
MSDAVQAQKWASEYIADLKPRLNDLYSTNYEMNFLKVLLGLPIENQSFKIEGLQAISLLVFADKDPLGYDLIKEIAEANTAANLPIPTLLADAYSKITAGTWRRPKRPGGKKKNGARDLIFLYMADHLLRHFKLRLGRNESSEEATNVCDIIADSFKEAGYKIGDPKDDAKLRGVDSRAVEKAIRRFMEDGRFDSFGHKFSAESSVPRRPRNSMGG